MADIPDTSFILTALKEVIIHQVDAAMNGVDLADGIEEKERLVANLTHEILAENDPDYLEHEAEVAEYFGADFTNYLLGNGDFDPTNQDPFVPPFLSAGNDQTISLYEDAQLEGSLTGGSIPLDSFVHEWSKNTGDGDVTFDDETSLTAIASFTDVGTYELLLQTSSEEYGLIYSDTVIILVQEPSSSSSSL